MSSVLEPLRQLPAELLDEPCAVCGHPGGVHWQPYGGFCVIEECKCNAFVKGATPSAIATLEHDARTPVMVAFCPLCGVPWPAIGEKLLEHQRCAVPGNTRELTPCEGSGLVLPREAFRPNGDPRFAPPEPRPTRPGP